MTPVEPTLPPGPARSGGMPSLWATLTARRSRRRVASLLRLLRRGRWAQLRAGLLDHAVLRRLVYYDSVLIVRRSGDVPLRHALDRIVVHEVRSANEADLCRLSGRQERVTRAFASGHVCLMATIDGQPVACNWYDLSGMHQSRGHHYRIQLPPGACWAYGFVVHPEHRLSGAFVKLWSEAFRQLSARGVSSVYGTIQASNQRSVDSHRRLGFEPVVKLSVWGVAGVPFYSARWVNGAVERGLGWWRGTIANPREQGSAGT